MRPNVKTKLECAVYAILATACLTACGAMFQSPPAASPVGPTGGTPAASTAPDASAAESPRPYEPRGEAIAFETLTFERTQADPEKPLPRQDNYRIKTQAELDAFLKELQADASGRPSVDFSKKEVLAFYDKAGGNGCDQRKLEHLFEAAGEIRYVYGSENELRPDPNRACIEIFIFPHYDLYAVPKSDKVVQDFKAYAEVSGK